MLPIQKSFSLNIWSVVVLAATLFLYANQATAARCLYVSSYHKGYEWNDGIERGIESVLGDRCQLERFYMDTKQHPESSWAEQKALEATQLIRKIKPDVVIVADDNASKYLVKPHFRDSAIPFVFCGLNWTIDEYGYPYKNTTGMVEVAPIKPLLKQIRNVIPTAKTGIFISASVATEYKEFDHYKKILARDGIILLGQLVNTMAEWEAAYQQAQRYDFIILSNYAGITGWDKSRAASIALKDATTLTVGTYDWMIPYVAFALTKVPEEQGEWAAKAALAVIDGMSPQDIPIIPNRRWQAWINPTIIQKLGITLPKSLVLNARVYK